MSYGYTKRKMNYSFKAMHDKVIERKRIGILYNKIGVYVSNYKLENISHRPSIYNISRRIYKQNKCNQPLSYGSEEQYTGLSEYNEGYSKFRYASKRSKAFSKIPNFNRTVV